ncbi:MAG: type 2 isopentenyl-diphosphate Delta-isomerase [Candidatus Bathyarchaeia archaeon]
MASARERKREHIEICLHEYVESLNKNWFSDIHFVHRALPEMDLDDVGISSPFFGRKLRAPIIIEGMTGGVKEAERINAALAESAERLEIAMGVGSQRMAVAERRLASSFRSVREKAPDAFIVANVGFPQISRGFGAKEVNEIVDMIDADAIAFHANPLQEVVQPGGETCYRGVAERLADLIPEVRVPTIVKETGSGVSKEDAELLKKIGIHGIDVAGCGGTSWAAVEYYRAKSRSDEVKRRLGRSFWNWGIPTTVSIVEVAESFDGTVIASGGIRSGIDVAKAIALGADCVGMALPLLRCSVRGTRAVMGFLQSIIEELRTVMFLVGARSIEELKRTPIVITARTGEWLRLRGFNPERYVRR